MGVQSKLFQKIKKKTSQKILKTFCCCGFPRGKIWNDTPFWDFFMISSWIFARKYKFPRRGNRTFFEKKLTGFFGTIIMSSISYPLDCVTFWWHNECFNASSFHVVAIKFSASVTGKPWKYVKSPQSDLCLTLAISPSLYVAKYRVCACLHLKNGFGRSGLLQRFVSFWSQIVCAF